MSQRVWWLTVARRQLSGDVWWLEQNQSVLVACFRETADIGRRVLVGAKSERVGGSLSRDGSYRETCVGRSKTTACWRLALPRRQISGDVCLWEKNHSVLVARFREKAGIIWGRVSVGAKSQQCVGG